MTDDHSSCKPCKDQCGKCYVCTCHKYARIQGVSQMAHALEREGIDCTVEQTGGFCMVGYIRDEGNPDWAISFTNECIVYGKDEDTDGFVAIPLKSPEAFVGVIKANLWRVGR